ncbi:class I SAM-dependent methyltransferase [Bacillus massilinigeriensis]|uniref:class I SAM-dependent methyltransferase n=1 Tax=Bacillus mediterraneensis TaxID=1805474 RepID=UPI000ACB5B6F
MKRRGRKDSPNNAIESPIIYDLIGNFQNKSILDLGCGDASFGKELLKQGAQFYTGIEGSKQMVGSANLNLANENGMIHHETMESYTYPTKKYDIVTSRFAIHYVSDVDLLFQNVHKTLKDHGKFVFSVQHPLTTSSFISKQSGDKRGNWIVVDLREGTPKRGHFTNDEEFSRRLRIPVVLVFYCTK